MIAMMMMIVDIVAVDYRSFTFLFTGSFTIMNELYGV